MSDPTNSPDTTSVIFLQASVVGPIPSTWQAGAIGPYGPVPALVSLSHRQVKALGLQTSGISGRLGSISSRSANLQSSLENRLRMRLGMVGSMELSVTWKDRVTPAGRQYFQRVPRMPRIDVTGFGSLPTPSGTSNHGKNHVSGRIDEWGGSSNYFRGKEGGNEHLPGFELWTMGYPDAWRQLMAPAMRSSRKSRPSSSKPTPKPEG